MASMGMRVPLITGFPARTLGSTTILFKSSVSKHGSEPLFLMLRLYLILVGSSGHRFKARLSCEQRYRRKNFRVRNQVLDQAIFIRLVRHVVSRAPGHGWNPFQPEEIPNGLAPTSNNFFLFPSHLPKSSLEQSCNLALRRRSRSGVVPLNDIHRNLGFE